MDAMIDDAELEELIQAVSQDDVASFEALFHRIHRPLWVQITARAPVPDLVDEVLQNTVIAIWEAIPRYRPSGHPWAWVRTIARNQLGKALRLRGQEAVLSGCVLDAWLCREAEAELVAEAAAAAQERLVQQLTRCLAELGDRARRLLLLHHVEGESLKQLARRFKQSEGSLATTLYRLRARLRQCADAGAGAGEGSRA